MGQGGHAGAEDINLCEVGAHIKFIDVDVALGFVKVVEAGLGFLGGRLPYRQTIDPWGCGRRRP